MSIERKLIRAARLGLATLAAATGLSGGNARPEMPSNFSLGARAGISRMLEPQTAYADENRPPVRQGPDGRSYADAPFRAAGRTVIFNGNNGLDVPETGNRYGGPGRPVSLLMVPNTGGLNLKVAELVCGGGISTDILDISGNNYPERVEAASKAFEGVMSSLQRKTGVNRQEVAWIIDKDALESLATPDEISNSDPGAIADEPQPCVPQAPAERVVERVVERIVEIPVAPSPLAVSRCGVPIDLNAGIAELRNAGFPGPFDVGSVQAAINRTVNCGLPLPVVPAAVTGALWCPSSVVAGLTPGMEFKNQTGKVVARVYGVQSRVGPGGLDLANKPPFTTSLSFVQHVIANPGGFLADRSIIAANEPQNLASWDDRINRGQAEYRHDDGPNRNAYKLENESVAGLGRDALGLLFHRIVAGPHTTVRTDAEEFCLEIASASRRIIVDAVQVGVQPDGPRFHWTWISRLSYSESSSVTHHRVTVPGTEMQIIGQRVANPNAFTDLDAVMQGVGPRQARPGIPGYLLGGVNTNDLAAGLGEKRDAGSPWVSLGTNY
ncbi:hypothetical protein HYW41_05350 [Candidatus Daviesbacteria bacterium]|nr:hypothetical protein [Candidatus Daviesbacteria bacterium]